MVCLYPSALLALCNAYCFDESDPQTHREFLEILLFWMHENYGNAESIYGRGTGRFYVPIPSSSYQKEIYDWFVGIKSVFEFSDIPRVTEWFYDVLNETEIELAFNMLAVKDQKQFIKHYESMSEEEEDAAIDTGAEEIDLLNITNDSIVSYINQDEDLEDDQEFDVHPNVTVRNVRRVIDFDEFVNELAEEAATERENNQTQDCDYDTDTSMPALIGGDSDDDELYALDSSDDSSDEDSSDDSDDDMWSQEDRGPRSITV